MTQEDPSVNDLQKSMRQIGDVMADLFGPQKPTPVGGRLTAEAHESKDMKDIYFVESKKAGPLTQDQQRDIADQFGTNADRDVAREGVKEALNAGNTGRSLGGILENMRARHIARTSTAQPPSAFGVYAPTPGDQTDYSTKLVRKGPTPPM